MTVDFNFGNDYDELSDESVQSPTLHTDLGIDRNELVRRLKQNIQNGQQDGYPFVPQPFGLIEPKLICQPRTLSRPTSQEGIPISSPPLPPRSTTPIEPSNRPLQFGVFSDAVTIQTHHRPPSPHPFSRTPPASPILSLTTPQPPRGYDPTSSRIPSYGSKRTSSFSSPLARPTAPSDGATTPTSEPIDISRPTTPRDRVSYSMQPSFHRPVKSYTDANGLSLGSGIPRSRTRRMSSVGTAGSELFGSFVGSYEESILNGRMSTTPSRPVPFIAQIGVLSLHPGTHARLRCPPHLSVPFPAVFYSVQDYDSPSPYVGTLDIPAAIAAKRLSSPSSPLVSKPLPVDGYRIPQRGQLQIIIKNPNKTAIKLFLIPYDLSDMPPRTKTFLRQKSYADDILRYAVHIKICSPSRDKFYIFGRVRVVFANRVPDGNERLRVENMAPDQLGGAGGRWSKWESEAAYAARMRRQSTSSFGNDVLEWNGETLEREVMMSTASSAATHRGRDKVRRSRGDLADLTEGKVFQTPAIRRITPVKVVDTGVVTGTKSPVPKRGEGVEQGLLAIKLRALKMHESGGV